MRAHRGRPDFNSLFITFVFLLYLNIRTSVQKGKYFFNFFLSYTLPDGLTFWIIIRRMICRTCRRSRPLNLFSCSTILINNRLTGKKIFPEIFNCLDGSLKIYLKELPGMTLIGVPTELLKVSMNKVFNLIVISDR